MTLHKITEFCKEWFSICPNTISKFCMIAILKSSIKGNFDSKKLVGIFMFFHSTELHLSKCNGSWVVSNKQNVNFNFQPPAIFIFLVFHKSCLIENSHHLKICQHTKFLVPTLIGASFACTPVVWTSHHCHVQKSVKENNDSNKTHRYGHDLSLCQLCVSATAHKLSTFNKMWILNFDHLPCWYFSFFTK
jgi:hypothetical protein